MARILFLNGVSSQGRLGYALDDLRLDNVYEVNAIGSVTVPDLRILVRLESIGTVVTLVHADFPSQNGCVGREARSALNHDMSVKPDSFAKWVLSNIKESDLFRHAVSLGSCIQAELPETDQVVVVLDRNTGAMYPVVSRIKGIWYKVNMQWQTAVALDFIDGVPELPSIYVPKPFRSLLERNKAKVQANEDCIGEDADRKVLVLTTIAKPVETIRELKPILGINGTPVPNAASVITCTPGLPGWWVPQAEAILERDPDVTLIFVTADWSDLSQIARELKQSEVFSSIVGGMTKDGRIRKVVLAKEER